MLQNCNKKKLAIPGDEIYNCIVAFCYTQKNLSVKKEMELTIMKVSDFIASCTMSDNTSITLYISMTDSTIYCTLRSIADTVGDVLNMSVLMWQVTNESIQIWC